MTHIDIVHTHTIAEFTHCSQSLTQFTHTLTYTLTQFTHTLAQFTHGSQAMTQFTHTLT